MGLVNFALRQQVEGFAELVSASGKSPLPWRTDNPLINDFRGPSIGSWTREWWLAPDETEADVVWRTASVPQSVDTTFTFIGESANHPENLYPTNQAKLYLNGIYALTFDLDLRAQKEWQEGELALQFTPRQVHSTTDGYHRQIQASGCCGIYQLAVPGGMLKEGEAVMLRVALEPRRSDAITWFALRQRTDALEENHHTNAEQIAQLQEEIIHLKRIVGNLARRNYPELFPERIQTDDVLVYTNGLTHVHPPDVLLLQNGDLLVAFREASEHLSLDGKLVTVRSCDGGKTWGGRQVLRETSDTDEREINLNQLSDGTLLFSGYPDDWYDGTGRYTAPHRDPTYSGRRPGIYVGRSSDNGHTWMVPQGTIDPAPFNWLNVAERMIELPGGRLLMPAYGSYREGAKEMLSAVYRSDDKGCRW